MPSPLPTNGPDSAMEQASATAAIHFHDAIATIDRKFGDGYAKQHPQLVHAFMTAAAADYTTWANGVNTAHLVQTFAGIQSTIGEVADAINHFVSNQN